MKKYTQKEHLIALDEFLTTKAVVHSAPWKEKILKTLKINLKEKKLEGFNSSAVANAYNEVYDRMLASGSAYITTGNFKNTFDDSDVKEIVQKAQIKWNETFIAERGHELAYLKLLIRSIIKSDYRSIKFVTEEQVILDLDGEVKRIRVKRPLIERMDTFETNAGEGHTKEVSTAINAYTTEQPEKEYKNKTNDGIIKNALSPENRLFKTLKYYNSNSDDPPSEKSNQKTVQRMSAVNILMRFYQLKGIFNVKSIRKMPEALPYEHELPNGTVSFYKRRVGYLKGNANQGT